MHFKLYWWIDTLVPQFNLAINLNFQGMFYFFDSIALKLMLVFNLGNNLLLPEISKIYLSQNLGGHK